MIIGSGQSACRLARPCGGRGVLACHPYAPLIPCQCRDQSCLSGVYESGAPDALYSGADLMRRER